MDKVKRYNIRAVDWEHKMVEEPDGEYVDFVCHETLVAALERRLRNCWRIIGKLVDVNDPAFQAVVHDTEREIDSEQKEQEG